jgi:hypothetical protein
MAVTAGFTLAMLVERKHFNIAMQRGPGQAVARYLSGAPGLFLIFFAFKPLISKDSSIYLALVFTHDSIMGLWVGLGAPLVFRRLDLEAKEAENRVEKSYGAG